LIQRQTDGKPVTRTLVSRITSACDRLEKFSDDAYSAKHAAAYLMVAKELRGYLELLGRATGEIATPQMQAIFVNLGVSNEDEAKRIIAAHNQLAAGYSMDEARNDIVEAARLYLSEHPEQASALRTEMFGEMEVTCD
jgi:hypothetical protein